MVTKKICSLFADKMYCVERLQRRLRDAGLLKNRRQVLISPFS